MLYRTTVRGPFNDWSLDFEHVHDRAQVFVDGEYKAAYMRSTSLSDEQKVKIPMTYGEQKKLDILVENMVLDLDELVIEDVFLSLPSRFLCKSDCKGLCNYCGHDLNESDCGCKKPVDPRLAALQQLLSDEE